MGIQGINPISHEPPQIHDTDGAKGARGFGQIIGEAVEKVGKLEKEADKSIVDLMQGKAAVHDTMIALQKSDLSMRLLMTVRNKVIDAYKEITHMQF